MKKEVYSVICCFLFTMNLGPENTTRSGAGSEERGNAVVKNMSSFCSLMYVAPDRFVYCSCKTCGDWKLVMGVLNAW